MSLRILSNSRTLFSIMAALQYSVKDISIFKFLSNSIEFSKNLLNSIEFLFISWISKNVSLIIKGMQAFFGSKPMLFNRLQSFGFGNNRLRKKV